MKKTRKIVILGIGVILIALAGLVLHKPYEETRNASDSEIIEALNRSAEKLNLLDKESEKEPNEEVNQEEVLEKENVESEKTINKKSEDNTKKVQEGSNKKKVIVKEEQVIKNEVVSEPQVKEYKPVGTVSTSGKLIAVYDNINVVHIKDYAKDTDRYEIYVWHKDMGWVKCIGFTGISGSSAPLSMEKRYYSYTSDVDTPEDRSYKVELVVYPHPDRQKEGKCNVYKEGTEELVKSITLNYY